MIVYNNHFQGDSDFVLCEKGFSTLSWQSNSTITHFGKRESFLKVVEKIEFCYWEWDLSTNCFPWWLLFYKLFEMMKNKRKNQKVGHW